MRRVVRLLTLALLVVLSSSPAGSASASLADLSSAVRAIQHGSQSEYDRIPHGLHPGSDVMASELGMPSAQTPDPFQTPGEIQTPGPIQTPGEIQTPDPFQTPGEIQTATPETAPPGGVDTGDGGTSGVENTGILVAGGLLLILAAALGVRRLRERP